MLSVLESRLITPHRVISSAAGTRAPLTSTTIRTTSLMLNFLTLCCNTSSGVSASGFLSAVEIYTSRLDASCLSCHLLTAVSSFKGSRCNNPSNRSIRLESDRIPWEIALSYPRSDILMACKSTHPPSISICDLLPVQPALHPANWLWNTPKGFIHLLLPRSGTT